MNSTDNINRLHDALSSKEFGELLDKATAEKIHAEKEANDSMKDLEECFIDAMLPSSPKINYLVTKKQKNDEERALIREWIKGQRRKFRAVTKMLCPTSSGKDPIQTLVEKIAEVADVLKFIGDTRLEDAFASAGMELEVKGLDEKNLYFKDNEEARAKVTETFKQAQEAKAQVAKVNEKIDTEYFEDTDPSLKFDKDTNSSGIKKADFRKLMKVRQVSMEQSSEKYTAFKKKFLDDRKALLEKDQAIVSRIEEM